MQEFQIENVNTWLPWDYLKILEGPKNQHFTKYYFFFLDKDLREKMTERKLFIFIQEYPCRTIIWNKINNKLSWKRFFFWCTLIHAVEGSQIACICFYKMFYKSFYKYFFPSHFTASWDTGDFIKKVLLATWALRDR